MQLAPQQLNHQYRRWVTNQALVYVLEIIITLYRKTKLDWDSYLPIESYDAEGGHCVFIMTLIVVALLNHVAYTKVGNTTTPTGYL